GETNLNQTLNPESENVGKRRKHFHPVGMLALGRQSENERSDDAAVHRRLLRLVSDPRDHRHIRQFNQLSYDTKAVQTQRGLHPSNDRYSYRPAEQYYGMRILSIPANNNEQFTGTELGQTQHSRFLLDRVRFGYDSQHIHHGFYYDTARHGLR